MVQRGALSVIPWPIGRISQSAQRGVARRFVDDSPGEERGAEIVRGLRVLRIQLAGLTRGNTSPV